jgi:hypothetical protein
MTSQATARLRPAGRALTLLNRIKRGRKQELLDYLNDIGTHIPDTKEIAFKRLRTVHFLRWVVLDDPGDPEGGTLLFESNYDGDLDGHLDELLREGRAVHRIYGHCEGYPLAEGDADWRAAREFLRDHGIGYAAFHVGNRGKSAERIKLEGRVRTEIEAFLNARQGQAAWISAPADDRYAAIRQDLEAAGLLAELLEPEEPGPVVANLAWILRLGVLVVPLLPVIPLALLILLYKEHHDAPASYRSTPPAVQQLAEREDFQVQNQLTHVVDLKPGPFRRWLLRGVLYAINLLARYKFNQGALGGISTIHFARWAFIDGGRRLLFFSNYDGSWESYLGDFIDKAHVGLTSVWSNTEGFPKTSFLAFRGAEDEDNFKAWTRNHQLPTVCWYSAYPDLTVRNIENNARICAGLVHKPADPRALDEWFRTL